MLRQPLRGLAVASLVAAAFTSPAVAGVTRISDCGTLDKAGETYVLTADITASSDCFVIQADRITLDLAGKTITGSGAGAGVGFLGNFTLTVVKNGSIVNFFVGIFLPGPRNTVRNVTASDNGVGIAVGSNSLVKDCTVQRNQSGGIQTGDGTQVEGCVIGGPDGDGNGNGPGLAAGGRTLATRNTAIGNAQGILVGGNSTVTYNTVGNNLFDGIQVGPGSLVTRNTSNDNGGDGIQAICPATITYNTALDNDGLPINTSGGCVILHNITAPPAP